VRWLWTPRPSFKQVERDLAVSGSRHELEVLRLPMNVIETELVSSEMAPPKKPARGIPAWTTGG
jgi:hypothetical protein